MSLILLFSTNILFSANRGSGLDDATSHDHQVNVVVTHGASKVIIMTSSKKLLRGGPIKAIRRTLCLGRMPSSRNYVSLLLLKTAAGPLIM